LRFLEIVNLNRACTLCKVFSERFLGVSKYCSAQGIDMAFFRAAWRLEDGRSFVFVTANAMKVLGRRVECRWASCGMDMQNRRWWLDDVVSV
jgi:hypothetical protein